SSLSIYAPATSTIYTLSLHDALPISLDNLMKFTDMFLSTIRGTDSYQALYNHMHFFDHSLKNLSYALQYDDYHIKANKNFQKTEDRKSTRLNSSHVSISYAVFCLKKK